jgi:hypothetical protein
MTRRSRTSSEPYRKDRWKAHFARHRLVVFLGIFFMAIAFLSLAFVLYGKISGGQGVAGYMSGTQVPRNYIGTAVSLFIAALIVLAIGGKHLVGLVGRRRMHQSKHTSRPNKAL